MTVNEFEKRASYQNGYDRKINHWKIIDVHQIPSEFNEKDEVDFYCCNEKKVYLLRLRYRNKVFHQIIDSGHQEISYLIAEFPFQKIDNKTIETALSMFHLK